MAVSWKPMRPRRVGFHESSWRRQPRCIRPCASICGKWKSRTRWKSRCTSRIRYRPRIQIPPTRPKGGTPARMGYYDNYLVDNASCVIVGVQGTAARMSQETVAAQDMLTRFTQWQGREPESVAADTTYGNGEFLQWLADRSITPYMRTRDSIHRKRSPFFGPDRFIYEPENNRYLCPAGQFLNYGGRVYRNRAFNYIGTRKSVARARSGHNAPVLPSGVLSSTRTNPPDNVRASCSTRQSSPKRSGKEKRWKPCSRN